MKQLDPGFQEGKMAKQLMLSINFLSGLKWNNNFKEFDFKKEFIETYYG